MTKMNKYIGLIALFSVLISCKSKTKEEVETTAKQPNVIIVITDDQGYGDVAHNGNTIIKTPTIDQFATESVSLTNYHVGTTCAPTRAGLLTGRNCNRNGVWHTIMGASMLNREEVTIADVFKNNGYKTGMFGKWHLGDNHPFTPNDRGFEEAFYHGGGGIGQTPDYWNNDYFDGTYLRNGEPEKTEGYCTDVWFDEAIKFVEAKKDNPFLCYLSLNAPHSPFNVPQAYYDMYKDEESLIETQKRFYGMITNIDDNFTRLLKRLDELEIADNTIVIFTTDNGTSNGYKVDEKTGEIHGFNADMRGTKASEYEGGHRVPFIIRWPNGKLNTGKSLSDLTAHVDMLPTLTTLANIPYTSDKVMDGIDISAYLTEEAPIDDRYLVTDTQRIAWPEKGKNSCVMDGDWRLINGDELYNLTNDPGQKNNIADQHPERVADMNAFYESWWESVIKEVEYSTIDLGVDEEEVITCHDARTVDYYPPWNQRMIRAGNPMKPASFFVNFVKPGNYTFKLRRWPSESGMSLGAEILDEIPSTDTTDGRIRGKAMKFKKAFVKIGDKEVAIDVDNTSPSADIELDVEQGKTELLAWFEMENGELTNAFYVDVKKNNN
ncbi:arylsulfatase [Winogradskyella psychrotolerans]|uniref:arylsulfatase n=1 Tax=Winogradskyella psychrotolerans TaxID=1344585 RepID=UPI001C0663EB|nr:arylsulfatase [Winogradskyella psychrotolerans]MBU2929873.1 arylsulfatase [Winogradskyella psychrotolerans]